MATKKDKDNNGPSTQRTATVGVNAVGVNHGMTQQIQLQTDTNSQQNPVVQPTQTAPTTNGVQPIQQQQFALPPQITMPNGQVVNIQPQSKQQQQSIPVNTGVGTVNIPILSQSAQSAPKTDTNSQQPAPKSTREQNEEYERQKLMKQAMDAGVSPNVMRPHGDILSQSKPAEVQQAKKAAQANAQKQAQTDDDEHIKTVMERIDELRETPEKRAQREKREARQRKWAAISEGIANVFNVGGAIAGAKPATWESGVGELYANQEAEADKRRLEYRQALKDMIDYRTAIRNGDIARARAIEERRKNDFYEYKMLHDQENKAAEQELKKQKQEADIKRNNQQQTNRNEEHKAKMQGTWNPSGASKGSSSKGGGGSRGKKSSGGSKATGAAAAKSARAAAKRRAKAATQGTKFGKK